MKKETVVRQARCDQEMKLLLFVCFFFYTAMQFLIGNTQQDQLVNAVNMGLYGVFAPGFLFLLGYGYNRQRRLNTDEGRKKWIGRTALPYLALFFFLTLLTELCRQLPGAAQKKQAVFTVVADVLSLLRIPAVSAVFFTLLLVLLAVRLLDAPLARLLTQKKKTAVLAALLLLCALLRLRQESYIFTAALFGSSVQPAVPAVPYFAFFLFGAWAEDTKPAFSPKLALGTAAVTAVSLLLYRTPVQDLVRVTASFLPVYLVYVASEGLAELSLRVRAVRPVCALIEPAYMLYALLLAALSMSGKMDGSSVQRVLAVAAVLMLAMAAGAFLFWAFTVCCVRIRAWALGARCRTAAYFAVYTAVFSVILLLAFAVFLLHGKTFICLGDGVSQYFPRVVYFSRYIRDFFTGLFTGQPSLPMYDFRIGLGAEVTYSLEPLYFLYALFGEEHLEFAYNLVTVLRFYFSGIAFSVLCLYFKKEWFPTLLGSIVYVICGFALNGGAIHTMFMVPMIMLPLLILSVEEILRRRRWYLCTVFVAVSLFSNYYYLYMNTIAMGVYFLVRFFGQSDRKEKNVRSFFARALTICGSYLLGVAMSCIVLVTTFGMYLGSGRGGAAFIKTASLFFYRAEWLLSCFLTFLTTANAPGEWMRLGHLPIAMLALAFLFLRKGRKELKAFSVTALVFAAFPVFGFIFSGFSAVINRWCYMITLTAAFAVADCYPDLLRLKKKEKRILAGLIAVYGFLAFFGKYKSTLYVQAAFVLLAATFAVLLLCQTEYKGLTHGAKQSLMLCLTAGIVFYQGFSLYQMDGVIHDFAGKGEALAAETDTPLTAVKEVGDEDFYRCAVPELSYDTSNASMMLDFYSNTMVNSTYNGYLMEYLEKMGSTSYSMTQLKGMNNRAFLDSLAAVRYYAYYEGEDARLPYGYQEILKTEANEKPAAVAESAYALPLGATYESVISEEELEQYPAEQRQEVMLQRAVLSDTAAWKHPADAQQTDVSLTAKELAYTAAASEGAQLEEHALVAGTGETLQEEIDGKEKNTYRLRLEFQSDPSAETYVVLRGAHLKGDVSEEPIRLTFRTEGGKTGYAFEADNYRYGTGQQDYVFNLGYQEKPLTWCEITMNRSGKIEFEELALCSQPMEKLPDYTKALTGDVLEHVKVETNRVSGDIALEKDKLLVLSIPYQKGWTAYVDGEETELLRANYAYMALPLTAGEHTVELRFAIPGVKYALVIMAGAVVLFIVVCTASYLRRRGHARREKAAGGK